MDDVDLIGTQGDYFFEEKFLISFCFDFFISSEWFQVQLGNQCIVSFGKESSFDVKKRGFAKALLYSRQKLCKAVFVHCQFGAFEA